jgi:uncharacterized protein YbcI
MSHEISAGMSVDDEAGERRAAISDAIVGVYHDCYGRGPTKAKTYLFDDYVLCVLEGLLTTVEQTLVKRGEEDLVRSVRLTFHEEEAEKFKAAVADVLGRPVVAYTSQVTFHPEAGFEMFVLGPAPD